jgi:FkbM family methyltransferase
MGRILDVGANWGYSVGSIRATGSDCPIVSFEVCPAFEPCLAAIKTIDTFGYDYVICGVGNGERRTQTFYIPAVNGLTLSALTTGTLAGLNKYMINNVVGHLEQWRPDVTNPILQFVVTECVIDSIDNLLAQMGSPISERTVAAIKIDVEGLEGEALWGAKTIILRDRPLLLLEGGMSSEGVKPFLDEFGYIVMQCEATKIKVAEDLAQQGSNGVFIHRSRLEEYGTIGLLSA